MATIKAASSKGRVGGILKYVENSEKTEAKILDGINCDPYTAAASMEAVKAIYRKLNGRQYLHFIQSFKPDEDITPEKAFKIAMQFADEVPVFKGFEVVVATHKDRKHIHSHFIVNSVSFDDGHKFQMSRQDLQEMKDISDRLCIENGLSVTKKGERAETTEVVAYNKNTYQTMMKAINNLGASYKVDVAVAVYNTVQVATSIDDFIQRLGHEGIAVKWKDSQKYITFTDMARKAKGEVKHSVRNKTLQEEFYVDFSKEGLLNEFRKNSQRKIEQQYRSVVAGQIIEDYRTASGGNVIESDERVRTLESAMRESIETTQRINDLKRERARIEQEKFDAEQRSREIAESIGQQRVEEQRAAQRDSDKRSAAKRRNRATQTKVDARRSRDSDFSR